MGPTTKYAIWTSSSSSHPRNPVEQQRRWKVDVYVSSAASLRWYRGYYLVVVAMMAVLPWATDAFATVANKPPSFVSCSRWSSSSSPSVSSSSSLLFVQSTSDNEDVPSNDKVGVSNKKKSTDVGFTGRGGVTDDASRGGGRRNHASSKDKTPWSYSAFGAMGLAVMVNVALMCGGGAAFAATDGSSYDGFAEYAKDNQMEQSDVQCFVQKCGEQTKNLFSNPRGIKGVSCLGRCKGEQSCATRCFAEFGSENLNNWLSCTIEENECVKVPRNIDNSAENVGYPTPLKNFDPKSLIDGSPWYKTDGLNPNYDLFDCQTNTFQASTSASSSSNNPNSELDMGIFFRVQRPEESGGGYWENALTEHMVVDAIQPTSDNNNPTGRTMHTSGKMYGLQFAENWYILGESDGSNNIPPFKLVAYKGHTLQGNYEGAFVYAKEPVLPESAKPAIREAAMRAGLNFDQFTRIDNTCPIGNSLNDAEAGTGTSTTDWVDLVIGEGGVIDWISPGWRGEYKTKQ